MLETRAMSNAKRFVITLASAACVGLVAVVSAACGPEEEPSFGDPGGIKGKKPLGTGGGSDPPSAPVGDAGASAPDDKGFPADGGPPVPRQTASAAHAAKGQVELTRTTDCMTCHNGAVPAAPKWAFGGYVNKGGNPVEGARVVVQGDANTWVATSGADGFFWTPEVGGPITGTVKARVRLGADGPIREMSSSLGSKPGACSQAAPCHGGTAVFVE